MTWKIDQIKWPVFEDLCLSSKQFEHTSHSKYGQIHVNLPFNNQYLLLNRSEVLSASKLPSASLSALYFTMPTMHYLCLI